MYRLAAAYRLALTDLPALTLIPDQWLHLTMQGIGFTDETTAETVTAIADEARDILADLPAFEVEFGELVVADEAIVMSAEPAAPVRQLRDATRSANRADRRPHPPFDLAIAQPGGIGIRSRVIRPRRVRS